MMGVYRLHAGGLWTGRAEEERMRQLAAFMEDMGRHMPHHAATAASQVARWRRALAVERRQAPLRSPELRRWLVAGRRLADRSSSASTRSWPGTRHPALG